MRDVAIDITHEEHHEDTDVLEADLKAKTGLSCYTDYLRHSLTDYPELQYLLSLFEQRSTHSVDCSSQHCSIIDVYKTKGWSVSRTFDRLRPTANHLFSALCNSLEDVSLRIVIWHLDRDWRGLGLIDTLGLILRLDPRFLGSLFAKVDGPQHFGIELRPLYAKHMMIGDHVVTFGQLEVMEGKAVPFVLIAGALDGGDPIMRASSVQTLGRYGFHQEICPVPTFDFEESNLPLRRSQEPAMRASSEEVRISEEGFESAVEEWVDWYIDLLRRFLNHSAGTNIDVDSLPLATLFPILQLNSLAARDWSRAIRSTISTSPTIENASFQNLYLERKTLRRWLEDTEDNMDHLRRCIPLHYRPEWLVEPIFQMIESESLQLVAQSRRLEAEVRDTLQIQAGASALVETKKSIELSNTQIQENRRVKSSLYSHSYTYRSIWQPPSLE